MKIPSDKKLVTLHCYIPQDDCIPLLDFLKKELPRDVGLKDVVLTETYHPSSEYCPDGWSGYTELHIGYLVSKDSYEKEVLKEKIKEEQEELEELEKKIEKKKSKLEKMRKMQ